MLKKLLEYFKIYLQCSEERQGKNKVGPEFQSDFVSVVLFTSVYNIQGGWSVMLQEIGHMSKLDFEQFEENHFTGPTSNMKLLPFLGEFFS